MFLKVSANGSPAGQIDESDSNVLARNHRVATQPIVNQTKASRAKKRLDGDPLYTFVFWSNLFDEAMTTVMTTELRKVGLTVRIVGLAGPRAVGIRGISIEADMTLGQALQLVDHTICVVLPCRASQLSEIENDPRVQDFLLNIHAKQARIVMPAIQQIDFDDLHSLEPHLPYLYACPDGADSIEFAQKFAQSLCDEPP